MKLFDTILAIFVLAVVGYFLIYFFSPKNKLVVTIPIYPVEHFDSWLPATGTTASLPPPINPIPSPFEPPKACIKFQDQSLICQ